MPLGITWSLPPSPQPQEKGLKNLVQKFVCYKIRQLFTHNSCYWNARIHFQMGVGTNFLLEIFPRANFLWGGMFPGSELFRGTYTQREFDRILIQNYFYMSCFLFSVSILRAKWLRVIVWGKFSPGLNFLEDISMERGFLRGGGVIFPGIIQKTIKN